MLRIFYDLETTGLDYKKNAIWQIAIAIEKDGVLVKVINEKLKPWIGAELNQKALDVGRVDEDFLNSLQEEGVAFYKILNEIKKYDEKAYLVGFNNARFDDLFLRQWLDMHNERFGDYFYNQSIDVMMLANYFLQYDRPEKFKQYEVARYLGIEVEDEKLHDAVYDIVLTYKIFNKIHENFRGSCRNCKEGY